MRVIVLGYIIRGPMGGLAWHHLHYVLGLRRLGVDVCFIEDSTDDAACYDPTRFVVDADPTFGLRFATDTFDRLGLGDVWAYWDQHTRRWLGPLGDRAGHACASADVVLNVSGVNPLRPWLEAVPRRVLIDTDPVFTQLRHLTDPAALEAARRHTAFFTFGENFGRAGCTMPQDGLPWQPTRQPVDLEAWPVAPAPPADAPFTTVMHWGTYRDRAWDGVSYGHKDRTFPDYFDLPRRSGCRVRLAVSGSHPRDALHAHGWETVDAVTATSDPWSYQELIRASKAEWSVAKHGFVAAHTGWFSERTCCYLASGRPALVQDTGFSDFLPTGDGVLAFSTIEEAVAGMHEIEGRFAHHAQAARAWVETHFAAPHVLPPLLGPA